MSQPKLALVEDDAEDAELVKIALTESGVPAELVHYEDGQQAIDKLLAAGAVKPALILLDLKLPRLDGKEVLKLLRAHAAVKLIPVVVMSSSDRLEDIHDCYTLGANGYVQKAVDFEEYNRSVSLLLKFWLTTNVCPP